MFINESGFIGIVLVHMTDNITGSLFLTLLLVLITILSFCLLFRIPIEWSSIIVLPLLITFASFQSDFISILGVFLIYMGVIFAKYYFVNV